MWNAELHRLLGQSSVDVWTGSAIAWDKLSRPHDAAYCRWRGAEAALAGGQRSAAERLLKRAGTDGHEHVPLARAITETAAYAPAT